MDDYSGRAELFLEYLVNCDIDSSNFTLQFNESGSLAGKIIFQSKATAEIFEGKFAVNYEPGSHRIIVVILMSNAVFKRTTKHPLLPQSVFITDMENFYKELNSISLISKI